MDPITPRIFFSLSRAVSRGADGRSRGRSEQEIARLDRLDVGSQGGASGQAFRARAISAGPYAGVDKLVLTAGSDARGRVGRGCRGRRHGSPLMRERSLPGQAAPGQSHPRPPPASHQTARRVCVCLRIGRTRSTRVSSGTAFRRARTGAAQGGPGLASPRVCAEPGTRWILLSERASYLRSVPPSCGETLTPVGRATPAAAAAAGPQSRRQGRPSPQRRVSAVDQGSTAVSTARPSYVAASAREDHRPGCCVHTPCGTAY